MLTEAITTDKKILIITGLTATGKTDLAIDLAKMLNGELVSCDSRQVYAGLDLGSGKLPGAEVKYQKYPDYWIVDGVKIWMYDVVDPNQRFDAKKYVQMATLVIDRIISEGKLPIIVGGTGLYLSALIEGTITFESEVNEALRSELNGLELTELQSQLQNLDFSKWQSLNNSDQHNPRRLIRQIELILGSSKKVEQNLKLDNYQLLKIGLKADRPVIKQRISQRIDKRLKLGMIEEAERLFKEGVSLERMKELGLEYGLLADYLAGKLNQSELVDQLNIKIGQYAKRQWVWFKRDKSINWFDITEAKWQLKVTDLVRDWYNKHH